jgi:dipeptidyl aminopeptidase/acylaminoacyl peptidase
VVTSLDYSPDGSLLATAGEDGRIVIWKPLQGTIAEGAAFARQPVSVHCVRFSPDGTRLLTTGDDGSTIVWDLATRRELLPILVDHGEAVLCGAWSVDGRWLVTGGRDKTARIWSSNDGRLLATLTGHSAAVTSVSISLDRMRVLSASQDNTAKLWDSRSVLRRADALRSRAESLSLVEVLTFRRHTREVTTVRFSPDGRHVLTASRDGRAIVWPGENLAPAITLSGEALRYTRGMGPCGIDSRALLNCPSLPDFEAGQLEAWLAAETSDANATTRGTLEEELAIGRNTDAGGISVEEHRILFASGGETNDIGTWQSTEDGRRLTVVFNRQATMAAVQAVVRAITYECRAADVEGTVSVFHCLLTDSQGRTGNASAETKPIQIVAPK